MPRHYRKPEKKSPKIKTYDKEMISVNKPKPIRENNIFENYSESKKDKVNKKSKIKK